MKKLCGLCIRGLKANTEKTPTQAMQEFCRANLDSEFIPMSVNGHDTVYNWHCAKDLPEALEQIVHVDAAGHLANIWYLSGLWAGFADRHRTCKCDGWNDFKGNVTKYILDFVIFHDIKLVKM